MSNPALAVDRLSFTFAGRCKPSLEDISFALAPGSWTVLAGCSGSGKSTLLRAAAGLIPHHSSGSMGGQIVLFGRDARHCNQQELASLAGLVLQAPDEQICTTTVAAEIAFGLENLAMAIDEIDARVTETLGRLGLEGQGRKATQQLSGGQKQRLLLAAIMAMQPKLLLLDEPLSQLDAAAAAELLEELQRLRQAGLTILFVEHRLDEVLPYADRVLVMDRGRLLNDINSSQREPLCDALSAAGIALPEVTQLARKLGRPPALTALEFCQTAAWHRPATVPAGSCMEPLPEKNRPRLLHVENVSVRFPRVAAPAIEQVSFNVCAAERIALVGPNGSGKSTLLAALAGLMRPFQGRIEIDNSPSSFVRGLMLQNPDLTLFCNSVRAELSFGPEQSGADRAEAEQFVAEAAAQMNLVDVLDEPPLALSQGQRLRVAVAALLTLKPQLLLLDEPTTGQDQFLVTRMLDGVVKAVSQRQDCGLIFSTHDLRSVARYADRVLVLVGGRLLADCSPERLLDDDELLAASRLRRPPLFEVRRRLGLRGSSIAGLAEELRR